MDNLPDQPTYGIAGACKYLHISETSLKALVDSGELACSKPGKEPVFRRQALEDYLTRLEIEQTAQRREAFERGVKVHVPTAVSMVRGKRKPVPDLSNYPKAA